MGVREEARESKEHHDTSPAGHVQNMATLRWMPFCQAMPRISRLSSDTKAPLYKAPLFPSRCTTRTTVQRRAGPSRLLPTPVFGTRVLTFRRTLLMYSIPPAKRNDTRSSVQLRCYGVVPWKHVTHCHRQGSFDWT